MSGLLVLAATPVHITTPTELYWGLRRHTQRHSFRFSSSSHTIATDGAEPILLPRFSHTLLPL